MSYSKVQFITYRIHTGVNASSAEPDQGSKQDHIHGNYVGLEDDQKDMEARVKLMLDAIQNAAARTLSGDGNSAISGSDTLKIFVAPEFYFRGRRGAYPFSMVDGDTDNSLTNLLCKALGDKKYKDWLFILGTTVMSLSKAHADKHGLTDGSSSGKPQNTKADPGAKPADKPAAEHWDIVNFSIILMGGYGDETATKARENEHSAFVIKLNISTVDFIHYSASGKSGVNYAAAENAYTAKRKQAPGKIGQTGAGGCLFEFDGIRFGLEVCLDHLEKRLSTRVGRLKREERLPQIQIVTSCGMWLRHPSEALGDNGILAICDGGLGIPEKTMFEAVDQLMDQVNPVEFPELLNGSHSFVVQKRKKQWFLKRPISTGSAHTSADLLKQFDQLFHREKSWTSYAELDISPAIPLPEAIFKQTDPEPLPDTAG